MTGRALRVLLVEDSADDAELALRELRHAGYEPAARVVENAAAMEAALAAGPWDIVLSDYVIPAFGGREALALARRHDADLPVILLSSKVGEETAVEAMKAGASDFVMKDRLARLAPVVERELADAAARRAMKRAQIEWRAAFDSVRDALFVHDADGRILRANKPYAALAGVEVREVAGRRYWELFPKRPGPLPGCRRAVETGQWAEDEVRTESGELYLSRAYPILDASGKYQHSVHAMIDITERDRVREALTASENKFRALIESSTEIFLIVDAAGKLLYRSESGRIITGYETADVLGHNVVDLLLADDRAGASAVLAEVAAEGGRVGRVAAKVRRRDGAVVDLEIVLKNCLAMPEVGGIVVTARDVGPANQARARIEKLNRLYATLSGVNSSIVHSTSALQLFRAVCEAAVARGRFRQAWVAVFNPADGTLMPLVHEGLRDTELSVIAESLADPANAAAPAAVAVREARVVCMNDLAAAAVTPADQLAVERGARGCAAVPIRRAGAPVAVLKLYVGELDFFDADQQGLLAEMSDDMSFALEGFARDEERARADKELRENEVRFRTLAEVTPDGIFRTDARGDAVYLNQRWCELAGLPAAKALGSGWVRALHPDDRAQVVEQWRRAAGNGHAYQTECRFLGADGQVRWMLIHAAPERDASGTLRGYVGTASDITGRKLSEERLRKSEERFRRYFDLGLIGMAITLPAKGFAEVNDKMCEILGYSRAELLAMTWDRLTHPDDLGADLAQYLRLIAGEIDRYSLDKRFVRKDGGVVYTTISVTAVRKADRSVDYLVGLMSDITERHQAEQDLRRALVGTIEAIAATVETRDPYTAGHQRRVAELAAAIAREMDLPAGTVQGIHFGALIHDLGKVQVPAELLSKPTRLTKLEYELIKTHPQAGYDIVKGIRFPWKVAEMVHQHHERLDGSGYPQRLKGDEIALEARILAVADVVEAMASHRPYRPGLGVEAALKEIVDKRGTAFDAAAVDACVRLFREQHYSLDASHEPAAA